VFTFAAQPSWFFNIWFCVVNMVRIYKAVSFLTYKCTFSRQHFSADNIFRFLYWYFLILCTDKNHRKITAKFRYSHFEKFGGKFSIFFLKCSQDFCQCGYYHMKYIKWNTIICKYRQQLSRIAHYQSTTSTSLPYAFCYFGGYLLND